MHPMMQDWLDELYGPDAFAEARRFLDVVARGGSSSPAAAHWHKEWKSRPGFTVVLARACALVAQERGEAA